MAVNAMVKPTLIAKSKPARRGKFVTPETFRLLVVVNSGTPSSATAKIASTTLGCMSKRAHPRNGGSATGAYEVWQIERQKPA